MTPKKSLSSVSSQTSKILSASLLEVGKLGKTIGLKGGLKFHLTTDFPEYIQKGVFLTLGRSKGINSNSGATQMSTYTISDFNTSNSVVFFEEIKDIEQAKILVNSIVYTSVENTKAICKLQQDEHFWFEIINFSIIEEGEFLGEVSNIERIGALDYLLIKTSASLIKQNLPKKFMIPYIKHFILETSSAQKSIYTQGAKAILEAS